MPSTATARPDHTSWGRSLGFFGPTWINVQGFRLLAGLALVAIPTILLTTDLAAVWVSVPLAAVAAAFAWAARRNGRLGLEVFESGSLICWPGGERCELAHGDLAACRLVSHALDHSAPISHDLFLELSDGRTLERPEQRVRTVLSCLSPVPLWTRSQGGGPSVATERQPSEFAMT